MFWSLHLVLLIYSLLKLEEKYIMTSRAGEEGVSADVTHDIFITLNICRPAYHSYMLFSEASHAIYCVSLHQGDPCPARHAMFPIVPSCSLVLTLPSFIPLLLPRINTNVLPLPALVMRHAKFFVLVMVSLLSHLS